MVSCAFFNLVFAAGYRLTPDSTVLFSDKNTIHVEIYAWPRTLLTYPVTFSGNIQPSDLILTNVSTGEEEPCQLSDAKTEEGRLIYARLSFFASLPSNGSFAYRLSAGKRKHSGLPALPVRDTSGGVVLEGGALDVLTPASSVTVANEAPAPIAAIGRNGRWMGCNSIISTRRKVLSVRNESIASGPLFTEQKITYTFENGGEYVVKVRLVKDYPFVTLDEAMTGLAPGDSVRMQMRWEGFNPVKRFGTQWDRNLESADAWLGIDSPVYTAYSREDPHWTGMGWTEEPSKRMIFRLSPYGGNSVREQTPVMSFWEEDANARELGIFVSDADKWNDRRYGIWQPTPTLSVWFRYTDRKLFFEYPLCAGTRSTALSLFPVATGTKAVAEFNAKLAAMAARGGKNRPDQMFYRYSQLLLMQYASLSLDKVKTWQLTYRDNAIHPANPFTERSGSASAADFYRAMTISPMAYYPLGLNFYPGVHSIEHRIVYSELVEDYLRFCQDLNPSQRQTVEGLFIMGGYVNMLEEMNSVRHALAGTANMAADGWCVPIQVAFLFPQHPMAKEWADFFEKCLRLYGLFYTRPGVNAYESKGGRWSESLGVYNWAYLRPTTHSNIAGELFDGKNRFASPYMALRARWMNDMLTAPVEGLGRCFPPHGAHGGGYAVPRYTSFFEVAEWLKYYDPLVAENMMWTGNVTYKLEVHPGNTDWDAVFRSHHPLRETGTNPHLHSVKYTGHGIVLRSGVDTPEELSIHLDQVDKGPNYRWGNQGEGNSGGLYFYSGGKVYAGYENEMAGDHIVNNLDGVTNFGVMKNGEYRTIGMNELKAPLYDFGFAQFAQLLSDTGKDRYVWPDYVSRSIMLAGTDYFILFDQLGTNWRGAGRFSWFNVNGHDFPYITFLSEPAPKYGWMTAQTPSSHGFYRDNFGSLLTLVTHKSGVTVQNGRTVDIPLLNDKHIADFRFDKKKDMPEGVVRIHTPKSSDMVFRHETRIRYAGLHESFDGTAGLIRRFEDGHTEMSLFDGHAIGADGLVVKLDADTVAAVALSFTSNNTVKGFLKTEGVCHLSVDGLAKGMACYLNGNSVCRVSGSGAMACDVRQGVYVIEIAPDGATPMESRILWVDNERGRAKVFLQKGNAAERMRMEVSYDGGHSWHIKGETAGSIWYLPSEDVSKVHVRAVSVNGAKEAATAPEFPVYFVRQPPHYPEGLSLRIENGNVVLSWGRVLGASKYCLYRRLKGDTRYQPVYEGRESTYTDSHAKGVREHNALPGVLQANENEPVKPVVYEYALTAGNGYGESEKSPAIDTDPASWLNWNPDTDLKFKRQSSFWLPPYVYPDMVPDAYYPE
jgi:hypothetical protein